MKLLLHPLHKGADGFVIEIHIGQRGKQTVRQKARDLLGVLILFLAEFRQPDQAAHKAVLQIGCLRLLAAHAGADAAAAARRLLALKAKHF